MLHKRVSLYLIGKLLSYLLFEAQLWNQPYYYSGTGKTSFSLAILSVSSPPDVQWHCFSLSVELVRFFVLLIFLYFFSDRWAAFSPTARPLWTCGSSCPPTSSRRTLSSSSAARTSPQRRNSGHSSLKISGRKLVTNYKKLYFLFFIPTIFVLNITLLLRFSIAV